jgi:hypothetical protein
MDSRACKPKGYEMAMEKNGDRLDLNFTIDDRDHHL